MKTHLYSGLSLLSDGQSRFLDGAGLDEHLQLDNANQSAAFLSDHLGSTGQLVDSANGSAKARYDYKSYGRLEGDIDNPAPANAYTCTGREDDGTGLMYYRARYYDPELEVFISQDPLGDAQRYVGGNPLGFVDPLGLWGFSFGISFGGTAEAGQPIVGAGATGAQGIGFFSGENFSDPHIGGFASGGAFGGGLLGSKSVPNNKVNFAAGAYAGAGLSFWGANAGDEKGIKGCAQTTSLNAGIGPYRGSIQYSQGANGKGMFSFGPPGLGVSLPGASLSSYGTYTDSRRTQYPHLK